MREKNKRKGRNATPAEMQTLLKNIGEWRDISAPGRIWAKRIDTPTDSNFWICFSASSVSLKELFQFLIDQMRTVIKRRLFHPGAFKYLRALYDRKSRTLEVNLRANPPTPVTPKGQYDIENLFRLVEHRPPATLKDYLSPRDTPYEHPSHIDIPATVSLKTGKAQQQRLPLEPLPPKPKIITLRELKDIVGRRSKISKSKTGTHIKPRGALTNEAWTYLKSTWDRHTGEDDRENKVELAYDNKFGKRRNYIPLAGINLKRTCEHKTYKIYLAFYRRKR